ncbi:MAG: hypothetical protein FJ297_09655 [Planctomycetes bacterium]|nr:hypothetical protein [Planctomycetota bacterium]
MDRLGRLRIVVAVGCAIGCSAGCTSIRSVMLHRNECNTGWQKTRHLPGVPITLKVPTHLQVTVVEKHYLARDDKQQFVRIDLPIPIRKVYTEFRYTERIFTVDFKRPASGLLDLDVTFRDDDQYFKRVKQKVVDETIEDVAKLVESIAPGGLIGGVGTASKGAGDDLREIESVVAVNLFEIEDPNFEIQVTEFLNCHLNRAHDAWVMPPGVREIRRLPLVDDHSVDLPLCPPSGPPPPMQWSLPVPSGEPVPADPRASQRRGTD